MFWTLGEDSNCSERQRFGDKQQVHQISLTRRLTILGLCLTTSLQVVRLSRSKTEVAYVLSEFSRRSVIELPFFSSGFIDHNSYKIHLDILAVSATSRSPRVGTLSWSMSWSLKKRKQGITSPVRVLLHPLAEVTKTEGLGGRELTTSCFET